MTNFFDLIDRFKYGILAVGITYMGLFMYLNIASYKRLYPIEAWPDSYIEKPTEEIALTPENIELSPLKQGEEITNTVNDVNDLRDRSKEDYSMAKQTSSGEQRAKEDEQRFFDEARAKREASGMNKAEKLTPRESEILKQNQKKQSDLANSTGSKNALKGKALVDFSLPGRSGVSLPAPSYKCGVGQTGLVFITIVVNSSGQVTSVKYEPSKSSASSECVIQEGLIYARKSKFSSGGPASQTGYITYEFISQ